MFFFLFVSSAYAQVYDGATFRYNGQVCRVYGAEAPHEGQFFYDTAKRFLAEQLPKYKVRIVGTFHADRRGKLCVLTKDDGTELAHALIERGYAWAAPYADSGYRMKQSYAQHNKFGLWNERNPSPPWSLR